MGDVAPPDGPPSEQAAASLPAATSAPISAPQMPALEGAAPNLPSPDEPPVAAQYSEDLMEQYGLREVLADLRSRKMRSTFANYITDIPSEKVPIRPRCAAGSLVEIAMQPANEDVRKLELFDERVLRGALSLKEGGEKPKMPDWLDVEVPMGEDERRASKKRREIRKSKKSDKKKRKRSASTDQPQKKKKKKTHQS